ncbi:aminotransferase class III-fold pyridoxal phosphate-dependent enzyme [Candidatus Bathyarchaeota archaeon]|jgi:glutamate-1-semialdehyde 2,1-aminomutase/spore coat polysaccharide biosynthesis protein SpsF|nr:aminotransferase class III-fold pyridoxal phosphate-dependent enzyme [Candidatus Bathyarchaeota archaeon]
MNRKKKVVAIVQARMASTRFPGKVLADIAGHPMLWHVINRIRAARTVDLIVVATSAASADDPVFNFCVQQGIACFRGHETDVLDRLYQTAKRFQADVIIRVTADCPLIDPQVIDKVARTYLRGGYDYVSNTLRYTYPDGLDLEIFSFQALEKAWREAGSFAEREHVTPYIRTSGLFSLGNVENNVDLSAHNNRWTVDEPADLEFIRAIYDRMGTKRETFGMAGVMKLLETEPSLMEINKGIIRNEGYYRSLAKEAPIAAQTRRLERSQELKAKAQALIPSCTQTFSKGPTQYVQGVSPVFLQRGQGSHVWDVDGNEYIDYPMALGAIVLGHNYSAVTDFVTRQIREGTAFSLPHPLEFEVADMLVKTIPCAEMVRFAKNGSDATSGAVRVARAYTNREIIACCGYHGWQDWYIGTTTRNKGVPKSVRELTIPFEYNDINSLERIFKERPGQVAAVILEPVGVVEPRDDFLQQVREMADREGALLIFDEIVTGFRIANGGAQAYYHVIPDLGCFGKAMANGYPISAVVGKREIMQLFDEVFFSFTFGGETASLAAALATITEMQKRNVIDHLWEQGQKLKDGYSVLANEFGVESRTECVGLPPRTVISFKDENGAESLVFKSLVQQECLKRGVLFSGSQNISYSHSDADVEHTLRVFRTALEILSEAMKSGDVLKRLEGPPVQPVFRQP